MKLLSGGDLRFAAHQLHRTPEVAAAIILSLALGIGFNVAVFSLVNGLFLKPIPGVRGLDRLAAVQGRKEEDPQEYPISYPDFLDYRRSARCFESLAAYQTVGLSLSGETQAERLVGEMVSADFFHVLGLRPALGRFFLPEETAFRAGNPVVVLSHSLWQRRFAGDPGILGRTVRLNGQPFTVVGVVGGEFRGLRALVVAEAWVPLSMYRVVFPMAALVEQRDGQVLEVVGRLSSGKSQQAANMEMRSLAKKLAVQYPDADQGRTIALTTLADAALPASFTSPSKSAATVLLAATGFLLLMTCANVGLLLWARLAAREREIAVRLAVGARRWQVGRLLLVESGLFALLAGAISLFSAHWTHGLLWSLRPPYLQREALDASLDWRVVVFATVLTILACLLCGLPPCLQIVRGGLAAKLANEPNEPSGGGYRHLVGGVLVTLQVTLCFLALAGASFFFGSLRSALRIDPGFDSARLLTASFSLPAGNYDEMRARDFDRRLVERIAGLPSVEAASLAENRLLSGFRLWRDAHLNGSPEGGVSIGSTLVDSGYFGATGIAILRGRTFSDGDRNGSIPVVIVNQTLARRYWPGRNPLGQRFRLDDEAVPVEVVGVAANSAYMALGEQPAPFLYLPMSQRFTPTATLHVRTTNHPRRLVEAVRRNLHVLDPDLPVLVQPLDEALAEALWLPRTAAQLLSLAALVGLALATVGTYGLAAHGARRRSREIVIRVALGAPKLAITRIVALRTLGAVGVGLGLGLALVKPLGRWLSRFLFGPVPVGIPMLAAAALLVAAAGIASLVPALRATATGELRSLGTRT